jgi:hypothetical protein
VEQLIDELTDLDAASLGAVTRASPAIPIMHWSKSRGETEELA